MVSGIKKLEYGEQKKRLPTGIEKATQKWQVTFDAITDLISIHDRDFRVIKANSSCCQFLNLPPEALIGQPCYAVFHKTKEPCPECPHRRALESKKPEELERFEPNWAIWINISVWPIFDEHGEVNSTIHLVKDITKRKQAEELFNHVVTSSRVGIYIIQDHKFQLVNAQFQKTSGYREDKLLSLNPWQLVLPEDRKMVRENATSMLQGKRSSPYEYRIVNQDGRIRWLMETVTSIQYRSQRATLGNFVDITGQKRAEKTLATQKQLIDRILASMPHAVLVISKDLKIALANPRFYETFRVKRREVKDRPIAHVLPIAELAEAIAQTLTTGEPRSNLEFRYKIENNNNNQERIMVTQIVPMVDGEEALLLMQDVTAERAAQEQLTHVGRLAAIGELAAGIAHELNNPLTGVIGYSELVLGADIPQEIRKDIEAIHSNAQRTVTIVRKLLTFARRQKPEKQPVKINDQVKHVLEMRSYELKVNNIEVQTELAEQLPVMMADSHQLEQAFFNIILNAEQAMLETHGRGKLMVRTEAIGDMIRISFTDDGPGIPEKHMSQLFTPFFTTKEPGNGTGLGLSICHGIVTEHGGRIYAKSKVGEGATFCIELPTQ